MKLKLSAKKLRDWKYLPGHLVWRLFEDDQQFVVVEPIAHMDLSEGRAYKLRTDNGQEFWLMEYQVQVVEQAISKKQGAALDALFDE